MEFRLSFRARPGRKRCAAIRGPQLALLFDMLQGSLQKIDFQDLLPDLTFQLRDPRLLRSFLAHAGKRPLPKLIVIIVRYADDLVVGFQHRTEAGRFLKEFRERLAKFGLELHPDKTRLIEFGRFAARNRKQRGEGQRDL